MALVEGIQKIGVMGCGQMGGGIAQAAAQAGYDVLIGEVTEDLLGRGLGRIQGFLGKDIEKGKITAQEGEAVLKRIKGTIDLNDFADCDIVIEAIIENIEDKRKLFGELEKICKPETIFCSNTSSLTVIEMATATKRPDKFGGMHFFNPVPVMKLIEVVKTITTSDETVERIKAFGESLGKTVVVAQDTAGFIVNRLLVPYLLDAIRVLEAGVATREDIDNGMKLGCGHPMGPLTLLDFIGLDTIYYIANIMFEEFREPRFAPPPLLKRMVLAGQFGRKSGKGFYEYK